MCHVVAGAAAPVANVDILPAGKSPVPVHDVAECAKFVFFMHGLEDGVRIDVCIQVKKGIYMYAVDTVGGMAGKAEILRGSEFGLLKKVVVEPSAARQRYLSSVEGKPACLVTEWLKPAGAASRASGLSFARCWFRAGRDGISWSSAQKSSISTLAEEEPLETRKEIRVSAHSRGFVTPPFFKRHKKMVRPHNKNLTISDSSLLT